MIVSITVIGLGASSVSEFRAFQSQQGQVVEARIINFDANRGLVELELRNKRRKKVKPSVFAESDQGYIRDWAQGKSFMSGSGIRFKAEKKVIKDWRESPAAGIERQFEQCVYICELKNGGMTALENLKVEYCVYWSQEYLRNGEESKKVHHLSDMAEIDKIKKQSAVTFQTSPTTLCDQSLVGGYYYSGGGPDKQDAKMKGVWVKVMLTTPSGLTFTRDFCEPAGVMKQIEWKKSEEK